MFTEEYTFHIIGKIKMEPDRLLAEEKEQMLNEGEAEWKECASKH